MKQYFMTLFLTVLCGVGHALPVGNPADPAMFTEGMSFSKWRYNDWWNFRVGFYGDYVFERNSKFTGNGSQGHLPYTRLSTNAGFIAINFWEKCDLFATLGNTRLFLRANSNVFLGNQVFLNTDTSFSWSLGGRLILLQRSNWFVGLEGQYFTFQPHIDYVRNTAVIPGVASSINYFNKRMHYHEWQVGASLAYSIGMACCGLKPIPYVAVKRSSVRADLGDVTSPGPGILVFDSLREQKNMGIAVGVTLIGCCRMSVNVEGRFVDESAFALNSQYRF